MSEAVLDSFEAVPDDRKIYDLWLSPYGLAAVTGAIECGLMEALSAKMQSARDLAKAFELNEESVLSVLRVLVAMGFAREKKDGFLISSDARAYLVASSPLGRMAELSRHFQSAEHKFVVRKLREVVPVIRAFGDLWKDSSTDNEDVKD